MALAGILRILVQGDTSQLESDLKVAQRTAQQTGEALRSAFDQGTAAMSRFAGGMANLPTLILGTGLGLAMQQVLAFADALDESADRIGLTTDAFQALKAQATEAGATAQQFERGIAAMNTQLGQAAEGSAKAQENFRKLGVSWVDVTGKTRTTEAVFRDVMDRLSQIPNAADRAAASVELFGQKAGPALVAAFKGGAKAMDEFEARARSLGMILDQATIQNMSKLQDELDALATQFKVMAANLMATFGPVLGAVIDLINNAITGWRALLSIFGLTAESADTLYYKAGRITEQLKLIPPEMVERRRELEKQRAEYEAGARAIEANSAALARLQAQQRLGAPAAAVPPPAAKVTKAATAATVRERPESPEEKFEAKLRAIREEAALFPGTVDVAAQSLKAFDTEIRRVLQEGGANAVQVAILMERRRLAVEEDAAAQAKAALDYRTAEQARVLTEATGEADIRKQKDLTQTATADLNAELQRELDIAKLLGNALPDTAAELAKVEAAIIKLTNEGVKPGIEEFDKLLERQQRLKAQAATEGLPELLTPMGTREHELSPESEGILGDLAKDQKKREDALARTKALTEGVAAGIETAFSAVDRAVTTSVTGIIQGTQSASDAFEKMGQNILISLQESVIKQGIELVKKAIIAMIQQVAGAQAAASAAGGAGGVYGAIAGLAVGIITEAMADNKKMAAGGIVTGRQTVTVGEAGPEAIIPLDRLDTGGRVTVNIIDQRKSGNMEQRESQGPGGQPQIDVLITDVVKGGLAGGTFDAALAGSFGLSRRGTVR
jgi:hypothetical protein